MDIFYIVVSSIAIILLILILTVIGIMMKNTNAITNYPPYQSKCPDYWGVNADGICSQPSKTAVVNNLPRTYNAASDDKLNKATYSGRSDGPYNFDFSKNSICDNMAWSKRWNIQWDGVSNSLAKC
jgi:hypothetical protein